MFTKVSRHGNMAIRITLGVPGCSMRLESASVSVVVTTLLSADD